MKLLGIDYGTNRVGIALSDEGGRFAFPHKVLQNDRHLIPSLLKLATEKKVGRIVIGESKNFRGETNPVMKQIIKFREKLVSTLQTAGLKIEIALEPEFLTSAEAERLQGKTAEHDASAAALILKSYIDRKK